MKTNLIIRASISPDLERLLAVERAACGSKEEAELVRNMLDDRSAKPILSLMAVQNNQLAGHTIFTRAYFNPQIPEKGAILGPLAVISSHQQEGVGGRMILASLG